MNQIPAFVPNYSVADYQAWPGDWELWNGVPIAMGPSPFLPHGALAATLAYELQAELRRAGLGDWTLVQEIDWIIDNHTVVRPDLMLIAGPATESHLHVAPILAVEIVSPATEAKDRNAKFKLYESQGVKHYLIADPVTRRLEAFSLVDGRYQAVDSQHSLRLVLRDDAVLVLEHGGEKTNA